MSAYFEYNFEELDNNELRIKSSRRLKYCITFLDTIPMGQHTKIQELKNHQ